MGAAVELRQLEYFVAVAEEHGLARAAERLRSTAEAVAGRIGALEGDLGLRLFEPAAPGHVRLTAAGERLLPEARAALAAAGRVRETAAGIAGGTDGLVRLGTSRAFSDRVYRALGVLAERRPRLRVRQERAPQDARLAAVRSGTFDAALVRAVRRVDGMVLYPVWTEPLLVALPAGHPLAARDELHPEQLARLPLRLAPRAVNPAFHDLVTGALPQWTPGPPFTTLRATLDDLAGAAEPSWTVFHPVGPLPRDRRLAFRALRAPRVPVSLAVRAGGLVPAVRALLEALTGTTDPPPAPWPVPVPDPRAAPPRPAPRTPRPVTARAAPARPASPATAAPTAGAAGASRPPCGTPVTAPAPAPRASGDRRDATARSGTPDATHAAPPQGPAPADMPAAAQGPAGAQAPLPAPAHAPADMPAAAQAPVPAPAPIAASARLQTVMQVPGQGPIVAQAPAPVHAPLPARGALPVHAPVAADAPGRTSCPEAACPDLP